MMYLNAGLFSPIVLDIQCIFQSGNLRPSGNLKDSLETHFLGCLSGSVR